MRFLFLAIIFVVSIVAAVGQTQSKVNLRATRAATIDGKIDEIEWRRAAEFPLAGGGQIYLKHDGTYLYVALRGDKSGFAQIYLKEPGETSDVAVIHASAALGRSFYKVDANKKWQPDHGFVGDIRDKTLNSESQKKLDDYLERNGWVANNNFMGTPREIEFKIKMPGAAKQFYLAAIFVADGVEPRVFPATLADDCSKNQRLVGGWMPADVKYDFSQWAVINIDPRGEK